MDLCSVTVILSTYHGDHNLWRQLDSIFSQKNVHIQVYIRDDDGGNKTDEIIKKYKEQHPEYPITYVKGENMGYAKSFWTALCDCPSADYYAFSDQDDVWKNDKLYKCILPMSEDLEDTAKLAYCRMIRCDSKLRPLNEQVNILKPAELNKKMVLVQTYNYGAATVFNEKLRKLICRCWPDVEDFAHDTWVGVLAYWFGKIYYIDEGLYKWIRYRTSVTGSGTKISGSLYRLKNIIKQKSYPNVAEYLYNEYSDLIEKNDKTFLIYLIN